MIADRCFVCHDRAFAPTDRTLLYASGRLRTFALACASCGLLIEKGADAAACRADLGLCLSGEAFEADHALPYGLDAYTLRIAATARRRGIRPTDPAQQEALRHPHAAIAAAAELFDLDTAPRAPIPLGFLCRPSEADALLASLGTGTDWAEEVVLLLDDATSAPSTVAVAGFAGAVTIASRPLAGDFGAQRNALAALSERPWMLQIDADETLEDQTGALLGALAYQGDMDGLVSIGLPRRNLVDGVLSDVFPDTQYRLNRRSAPYAGRVHERPVRDWQRSTIALHGAILHRLGREHVMKRSLRYDALDPGRGRLDEAHRLLEPYRA